MYREFGGVVGEENQGPRPEAHGDGNSKLLSGEKGQSYRSNLTSLHHLLASC